MSIWKRENINDIALKIILFFFSPFIAFLYSLRTIKTKSSYTIFFLFCVFFGLAFTVNSGKNDEDKSDGASYREIFESYKYVDESEYYQIFTEYITFKGDIKDYYFDTVAFFVSQFTDNYHIMFMLFAMVFAYFGLISLKFLTAEPNFDNTLACLILYYLFLSNQIYNINGVRFWTAGWIGVYCIFQIYRNENKSFFFLALLTPFIHGSFWIYLLIISLAYLAKWSQKVWTVLYFTSFLVSNISVTMARAIIGYLPSFLAGMAQSYTDDQTIEESAISGTGFYWVADIFDFAVKFYINYMVWLFIRHSSIILSNPKTKSLFAFLLVWMSFANFTMPIPSLGSRFIILAYPIIAYIWLVNFKGGKYQGILYAMPFVFLFSIYHKFLLYSRVLELQFYFSNPFYLIYEYLLNS